MQSTRRRVLQTLAGSVPLTLAGCATGWRFGGTPERTIIDTTFELGGFEQEDPGNALELAEEARVEWHGDDEQVTVTGFIWYGSGTCNRPVFDGARYEHESDRLTVVTTFGQKTPVPTTDSEGVRICTDDLNGQVYTVRVTFEGGLPGHVVVKQFHKNHDTSVTAVTR